MTVSAVGDVHTKPDQAAQIRQLATAGLRFAWMAGDKVYGRSSLLHATCDELDLTGVSIVPFTFTIINPGGATTTVAEA